MDDNSDMQTYSDSNKPRPIGLAKDVLTVPTSFFESLPDEFIDSFWHPQGERI